MLNDQYGAMRREEPSERERLLEAALDQVPYGVQIYDQDAHIVFFNRASKEQLLGIPLDQTLQGQALLDVFAVRPDYSTTMTALRRGKAMNRRFDRYKSTIGVELNTITSAYPVAGEDGETLGCVTFERNLKMTKRLLETGQQDQQTLLEHQPEVERSGPNTRYTLADLIGSSPGLVEAKELARKMAARDNNILIQGETGTGKEIFAQGIHNLSLRRRQKFVAVNCAAFPETLIEGMLFGTVKGAFTGSTDKVGLMEEANHGTLFLDELNSMSLGMQAKLLRALQERLIQRIGGTGYIPIDVRVIASCNEDAYALSETGKLRKDLFYRLASVVIDIPPLRERLEKHSWPGNVRELFHIMDYALSVSEGGVLTGTEFPGYFLRLQQSRPDLPPAAEREEIAPASSHSFNQLVQNYQRRLILQAYQASGENVTRAARQLGLSRQNVQYYLKKFGLNQEE